MQGVYNLLHMCDCDTVVIDLAWAAKAHDVAYTLQHNSSALHLPASLM